MSEHVDEVARAAATAASAEADVARLRSVSDDLDKRSLAAAQATELASSNHRRGLGQRELGEPISDAVLAKLKSDRADAVFVEEGLAKRGRRSPIGARGPRRISSPPPRSCFLPASAWFALSPEILSTTCWATTCWPRLTSKR